MLANNNRKVIDRMAKSAVKNQKGKNLILFFSVVLSAFMLFSIFTVGITYFKMNRLQNIRLNGGVYDAVMYGITEEQLEKCEADPDIDRAGIIAMSGYIESTEGDDTVDASCIWADPVSWDEIMAPARDWVKGEYPQSENEVMVTAEGLEKAGLKGLTVGDSFSAGYRDGEGRLIQKEFTISGMWDGYGTKSAFYVSEEFYRQSGYDISEVRCGRYQMDFGKWIMTEKEQEAFIESMDLGKQQAIYFTGDMGYSLPIFLGLCGLICVTCLCACLVIYNIMYLSVAGNVRYYGLLQTVGMTGRQVRRLIGRQMLFLGGAGILTGILAGCGVSFFLFPSVIRFLGIRSGTAGEIRITLNPAVLLLTVLLTGATVWISSRKPAKMASIVSPVEAAGYRPGYGKNGTRRTHRGKLLTGMALDQIRKDKRKSAVIMVSLAAGMSVFLCLSTLIESQGARTIVMNHMDSDMTIKNDTLKKEDPKEREDLLTDDFLRRLRAVEGVEKVYPLLYGQITVPWEPEFSDRWMREFYAKWMYTPYEDDVEEYKEHPENFASVMIGITEEEFPYLQETMGIEIDREDFLSGKTCVLYRNDLELEQSDVVGKEITCGRYEDASGTGAAGADTEVAGAGTGGEAEGADGAEQEDGLCTFRIAGMTDEGYYTGPVLGCPPTVIVSDTVIKEFLGDPCVWKAQVMYEEEYDETTENAVKELIGNSEGAQGFSWESKLESMQEVERAQGNMKEVGMGIALILALIGILNYVNTVTGNIQSRQRELAVLESVGMTDRQRNRLLVTEGLFFAAGSLLITATAGLGVTYVIFQSMNYMQAPFTVPVVPVAGMSLFILAVCTGIPVIAGARMIRKGSVMERVRGSLSQL